MDEEVEQQPAALPMPEMTAEQQAVWSVLGEPKYFDELIRELNKPSGELTRLLMTMELKRLVRRPARQPVRTPGRVSLAQHAFLGLLQAAVLVLASFAALLAGVAERLFRVLNSHRLPAVLAL